MKKSSPKSTKLRALGITCGIGSMLVGARNAGFNVIGNIEWRKYYHAKDEEGRNTFLQNFPGAFFLPESSYSNPPPEAYGVDIVLGHPECGAFSNLNSNKSQRHDPGDIPLFVETIAKLKPRFFVMDDLPKSFIAYPMSKYAEMLPDYDLFPEWISNHGYGNIQKQRKRMFMLGALKTEKWAFVPGEFRHERTVKDTIADLVKREGKFPNHDVHALNEPCAKALHLKYRGHRASWKEMRDVVVKEMREGAPIQYVGEDGRQLLRVGSYKGHWEGPAHVLTGGISGFHPLRGTPYTVRERARIQGFPDDFIFYGTVYNKRGEWNHDKNMHMVKQTGKAMPIQFCEYVSRQVYAHINGKKFEATNERVLPDDPYIDQAKKWYCEKGGGYANQQAACDACWMRRRCHMSLHISPEQRKEIQDEERRIIEGGSAEKPKQAKQRAKRPAVEGATEGRRRLQNEPVVYSHDFKPLRKSW